MSRTRKIVASIAVVLLLMVVAAYFVGNYLLDSYSRQFMSALAKRGKKHGVVVTDPQFVSSRIAGLSSARWTGLFAELQFPNSAAFDPEKKFEFRARQLDAWLAGDGMVTVQATDLQLATKDPAGNQDNTGQDQTLEETVNSKVFQCTFPMELSNPMPGLEEVLGKVVELIQSGATTLPLTSKAVLEFTMNGKPMRLGMGIEQQGELHALVLSKSDLQEVSQHFQEELTDAEVGVLAEYPLRAAQLLRMKDDAESTSFKAKQADDSVPQDAYRHVLWSYLLTNKYGADFAKRVTDAHEEGDTGNTPAERDMDFNNNAVGRELAQAKVRRVDILKRVKTDPEVIREAR